MASAGICLLPTLLLAHPGHYHPGETDEFDAIRSTFLHSHGGFDLLLVGIAVVSSGIVLLAAKPGMRMGALAIALSSLSFLAVL